jgi:hypothetical protein
LEGRGECKLYSQDYTEEFSVWGKMSRFYKRKERQGGWERGSGEEEDVIKAGEAATEEEVYGHERGANEVSLTNLIAAET